MSHKYTRGGNTLVVYLIDRHSEGLLAKLSELDVAAETSIIKAVREEIDSLPPTAQTPVILTTMEVRRKLRKLVTLEFPHLAVLSYQELSPDMNIQPIARIAADLPSEGFQTARQETWLLSARQRDFGKLVRQHVGVSWRCRS
jgi:type III secretion protein V